jgi:hypothetical protein
MYFPGVGDPTGQSIVEVLIVRGGKEEWKRGGFAAAGASTR